MKIDLSLSKGLLYTCLDRLTDGERKNLLDSKRGVFSEPHFAGFITETVGCLLLDREVKNKDAAFELFESAFRIYCRFCGVVISDRLELKFLKIMKEVFA